MNPAPPAAGPRVAVMGAGAVGCYYGGLLARAGLPVTLIGRPAHVQAIRRDGLRLQTTQFDERLVHLQASTDAAAVAGARLVLCCVKSTDTEAAGAAMAPHLAPDARVLSLQNGVDNAGRLQAVLHLPVWPAVVYVAAEMAGAGHVRHHGRGELVIGPPPHEAPAAAQPPRLDPAAVLALFARAGVPATCSDDVAGALWAKLLLNVAYNALSAIARVPYGVMVQGPGVREVMRDAVTEGLAVAAAVGVAVPGDVFAAVDRIAETMPGQYSSTAQDLMRGRRSEIEHLNGTVVREGARRGVATPVNRTLLAIVRLLETAPAPGPEAAADPADAPATQRPSSRS